MEDSLKAKKDAELRLADMQLAAKMKMRCDLENFKIALGMREEVLHALRKHFLKIPLTEPEAMLLASFFSGLLL